MKKLIASLQVYHISPNKFTKFDISKSASFTGDLYGRNGIYFATKEHTNQDAFLNVQDEIMEKYGKGYLYTVSLDVNNDNMLNFKNTTFNDLSEEKLDLFYELFDEPIDWQEFRQMFIDMSVAAGITDLLDNYEIEQGKDLISIADIFNNTFHTSVNTLLNKRYKSKYNADDDYSNYNEQLKEIAIDVINELEAKNPFLTSSSLLNFASGFNMEDNVCKVIEQNYYGDTMTKIFVQLGYDAVDYEEEIVVYNPSIINIIDCKEVVRDVRHEKTEKDKNTCLDELSSFKQGETKQLTDEIYDMVFNSNKDVVVININTKTLNLYPTYAVPDDKKNNPLFILCHCFKDKFIFIQSNSEVNNKKVQIVRNIFNMPIYWIFNNKITKV